MLSINSKVVKNRLRIDAFINSKNRTIKKNMPNKVKDRELADELAKWFVEYRDNKDKWSKTYVGKLLKKELRVLNCWRNKTKWDIDKRSGAPIVDKESIIKPIIKPIIDDDDLW